ncbi:hypothetical protein Patl1_14102 [Pistacia atlantica]|uniref:Uncharacterized protein n=1 Tax=Pistacia atlantica TaxID=434234 RepID=A0ACC1AY64_9ROSI|nr:hypothetical protein Patl1_14102 [Pistacia atlantica]
MCAHALARGTIDAASGGTWGSCVEILIARTRDELTTTMEKTILSNMGWEGQNFLKEAVFSKSWEKQLSTLEVLIEDASLRELRASSGDLASSGENLSSIINRERDTDFGQQNKKDNHDGVAVAPCFQSGVLRTNCIDCLDRTNVAQYAYGLAALGRQVHAMGLTDMPKVDPNSSIAAALMDMYQSMGDALAQQYGGSAANNSVFPERQGRWRATTQSREFLKSIKRYYTNAYTDGEKQDAINLHLFLPLIFYY